MAHVLIKFTIGRHFEGVLNGNWDLLFGLTGIDFVEDFVIIQGFDGCGFEEWFL